MPHDTFAAGNLTAIIGDNAANGQHRAGYNGLWSLVHATEPANLFVPTVAGLNLEHIFDGHRHDTDNTTRIFFEPRNAAMNFRRVSASEAELYQPPTPTFHLESWTTFRLVAPHYVDMTFRCRATQHVFQHNYIGLFWANYINAPEDRSMYFRRGNVWHQLCTQQHNDESTVRHVNDNVNLQFSQGYPQCLYRNFSPLRYDRPFFYGQFRNHTVVLMFENSPRFRLTHSPSGGGVNAAQQTTNPAWDFQYIIPNYEVNSEYQFRARLVYRPRCSRGAILQEVENWLASVQP